MNDFLEKFSYKSFWKRFSDLVMASVLIIILLLPMLVIAALIKVTSKGPIIFKQVRFGKDSSSFEMYKFRTMKISTPLQSNNNFVDIARYLTLPGKFLRYASLDELPQLFNVLKGDMSIVGPRPMADSDMLVVKFREQNGAAQIRPGITGCAQVNGRNILSDRQKADYDGQYAQNISLEGDIVILLKTVWSVYSMTGINHS
ncbi:sugar transferase [Weissella muntiaci]|uniref:Sugar transferase n=1 Tax=Weissella muntiaci TaxID=2508881 RepID=A0A6C2C9U8_9LACO|nr:sugar transferase [Weissella muntiaci]TYC50697.1 sugar transferase [Weissella muntiaci]